MFGSSGQKRLISTARSLLNVDIFNLEKIELLCTSFQSAIKLELLFQFNTINADRFQQLLPVKVKTLILKVLAP